MEQTQCPNCGGYKVESKWQGTSRVVREQREITLGWRRWWIFVSIIFLGIPLLEKDFRDRVFGNSKTFEWPRVQNDGWYNNICYLCGYQWNWTPGTPKPVVMLRPDLIAKGEQQLREEEEDRRARHVAEDILWRKPWDK